LGNPIVREGALEPVHWSEGLGEGRDRWNLPPPPAALVD